ncbi:MAG: hypothetical protein Q7N50_12805 [Armatimonadota bacterium]|nr:hypothetical protein [Armatimonadota bacterium]
MEMAGKTKKEKLIFGIRGRVVALILITQALIITWVSDSEIARGIYLICYALMMPTVLYLLLARILRRWLPFEDKELLFGYIVLTATVPIVGFGGLSFIVQGMGYVAFFADSHPQWARFVTHLTGLPVLHDPDAIRRLYMGGGSVPWRAWVIPIVFWSAYLLLMSGIWLSLAGIMRRIWIHQERLTFPIATMPLQITDPRDDIFRRPIFWIGFVIPVVLQSLLVLHDWVPAVPAVQLKAVNVAPLIFTSPPWNAIPAFNVGFYPMAIGLAYFIPSEVSFSCWFLYVLMTLVYLVMAIFNPEGGAPAIGVGVGSPHFPYPHEQAAGAWIAFAGLILWGSRRHLRTVLKSIPAEERAAIGRLWFTGSACALLCAGIMMVMGVKPVIALGIILIYVAYVLSGARVRATAGGQWTFAPLWTPHHIMTSITGTAGMGDKALVAGGHFDLVHVDIRAQSLPYLMEGLYIAEKSGIKWRTVLTWVGIGCVTALAFGWITSLNKLYSVGAATAKANPYPLAKAAVCFDGVDRLLTSGASGYRTGVIAMGFGAGITLLLAWIRSMGLYGLHPVGYVLCNTLTIRAFAVPFFIAWLIKVGVMHWGGHKGYRASVPLFVGVVLGDVVVQAVWALVGWAFNVPIYQFLT